MVIPTYNEKENIENLIDEILRLNLDLDILVIDDNSDDGTVEVLDKITKSNSRVFAIHRQGERGRGLSGIEGFKWALAQGADYIVEMDADFSHDPRYIPIFLREIRDCDVVIGSRRIKDGKTLGRIWMRNYLSQLAQLFCRFILGINIMDATSGFRCFKRHALEEINLDRLLSKGPSIVEEINFYLQKRKFKIKEIPIVFMSRRKGSSKLSPLKIYDTFWTLMKVKITG